MQISFTIFLTTPLLWFCCAHLPTPDVLADEPTAVTENPQQPAEQQSADEKILRVVADLSSADFAKRMQASRSLKTLNAGQLSQAIRTLDQQASAEAVVRLLAEIDDRYVSDNPKDVAAASQALEAFADQSRQLIADGAQHSLAHHWLKRVQLAQQKLEEYGAVVKNGTFTTRRDFMAFIPPDDDGGVELQILLGDRWKGGDEGIKLFERFQSLLGTRPGMVPPLSLYLLDGHTVSEQQKATLIGLVGRIQERSAVALGIGPDPRFNGPHVLIMSVAKSGSAEAAGMNPGDLIVAIEAPNKDKLSDEERAVVEAAEDLRDFDDLVERLRKYRRGDVIRVRIVPEFMKQRMAGHRGDLEEKTLDVTLKGWEELEAS